MMKKFISELNSHRNMIQRCNNSKSKSYKDYGGRGVTVCDRWTGSGGFSRFLEDMGPKPDKSYQIDRIDSSLGYSPENCRWVTQIDNLKNRRSSEKYNCSNPGGSGVGFRNDRNKWRARLTIKEIGFYEAIGHFDTKEEALAAIEKRKEELKVSGVLK